MRILVTGGMGFIGSHFVRHIYRRHPSYEIVNIDALTYAGNPENLADIEAAEAVANRRRYWFVKGDIADAAFVERTVKEWKPDAIVNFAAESHVDRSFVGAAAFILTNVLGVEHLLQAARAGGIKFVQISTDEIYGDVPEGESSEESPLRPSNPYAASKAAADLLVRAYMRSDAAPAMLIRGSNNFGSHQYPEKLIPLAITNLLESKKVPVHGTGRHVRRWIHVDDFVEGIDLALHRAASGSIYNLAGRERANLDLLRRIATELGLRPEDAYEHVPDRPSADHRYAPSAAKAERELGWKPKRHIDEALPGIIAWYRANPSWWRKVKEKREFRDHYEKQRRARYY